MDYLRDTLLLRLWDQDEVKDVTAEEIEQAIEVMERAWRKSDMEAMLDELAEVGIKTIKKRRLENAK